MTPVALVSGAARGIGAAVARRLARDGFAIVVLDVRDGASTVSGIEAQGGIARSVALDVRDAAAVAQVVAETADGGELEALVNAHGITGPVAPLIEHDASAWRDVLDVNLTGAFHLCHAVVPSMCARGRGRIVNVASVAGKEGNPNTSAYSASKAGLIAMTKVLAREVAERGVLVNCVTPGVIDTPMVAEGPDALREYIVSRTPMRRLGRPEEVAELVAWLCSDACSFTTGAALDISGGRASY
jgi:NAD(P)-dependent dehydrogenase (short-subunit alcohol dehydrogenase family)